MKIAALTDIHGSLRGLDRIAHVLADADVVLIAGDLTHFGSQQDAESLVSELQEVSKRLLAVPGNCDPPAVQEYLLEVDISLHGRCVEIDGYCFAGAGGSLACPGATPNEFSEAELEAVLWRGGGSAPLELPLIVAIHHPPFETIVDELLSGKHVGSNSVRRFIEQRQPQLCFTGHIHEAAGQDHIGSTPVINPGPFSAGGYALATINPETALDSPSDSDASGRDRAGGDGAQTDLRGPRCCVTVELLTI